MFTHCGRQWHGRAWLLGLALGLLQVGWCAAAEFSVEARDFDGGNVRVSLPGQQYAGGPSCIWNAGELPNWTEYELAFPVTAEYTLYALYTAHTARPVEISLDGEPVHTGFRGVTGSWDTKSAKWEEQCRLRLERGTHTIRLECRGPMPHICALRLASPVPFPEGWTLPRPTPEQRAERRRLKAERERVRAKLALLEQVDPAAVRLAIADMEQTFPGRYDGARHRQALSRFERGRKALLDSLSADTGDPSGSVDALLAGIRSALLANPLLDVDRLLVVRRDFAGATARRVVSADAGFVGRNYQNHTSLRRTGWDNEIVVLSNLRGQPRVELLFKSEAGRILRDVDLDFPADRMLFSSADANGRWAIYEVRSDGSGATQLSPAEYPDLDFFDACYLPDGRIILCSTGNYYGLPCLNGNGQIASLYLLDPATKRLRQLTFDQDSDNDPAVLNDGRVLFQRWEYSDIPHYFSRRRMSMNPDGTGQLGLYGSNSWFPPAFRFARPVPGHATLLAGIISGHHDHGDCGRMALLDPGLASGYPFRFRPASKEWGEEGSHIVVTPEIVPPEQGGFVQLIPGRGKPVPGIVCDDIVKSVYLKEHPALTTHPYPLSSKYFLVSMKPTRRSLWGIYLVDVFDNATLIAEIDGAGLFEPQLLMPRPRPPVIPDRVRPESTEATVHIADIHNGPGLRGVPRGTVTRIRAFAYHFGYNAKAGFPRIGTQAGWDVKRVLGTATVESDGSAHFRIPANTPVSIQPLDSEGRAVQLMRSWFVGMPGEQISCVGCHESRKTTLPPRRDLASRRAAERLTPWYGPPRPFAFAHEVFPVLEKYCAGCHAAPAKAGPIRSRPCFKDPDTAYDTLHPYVHRPGVESDMALLYPMEYHASTSLLMQMLEKGHHGVTLAGMTREARERITCWIDLNVPRVGSWAPPKFRDVDQRQRRCELAKAFADIDTDPEGEFLVASAAFEQRAAVAFVPPAPEEPVVADGLRVPGFPLRPEEALRLQQNHPVPVRRALDLGDGLAMTLVWIPAGELVMGSLDGAPDERPRAVVSLPRPFWMATTEVTNAQYAQFDPDHDTRYIDMHYMDRVTPGYIANHADQPVARVSWQDAMAFCEWLSRKTGFKAALPTEAEWEWAARAGTETRFWYGSLDTDFGAHANLADQSLRWFKMGFPGAGCLQRRRPYPPEMNFPLHDERFRDKYHVVDYVAQCEPNVWGLHDMVGNVSEWTRSSYHAYPYVGTDGRNAATDPGRKVARGGSWADRPADAGSSVRRAYEPWQRVYDVGFRVIMRL